MLVVIEKGAHSLAIVDPTDGKVVASVPEDGVTGHEVAASPDGRFAYVPIYGDSGVGLPGTDGRNMVVIDVAAHKVTGNVDFGHGVRPHLPVWGPGGLAAESMVLLGLGQGASLGLGIFYTMARAPDPVSSASLSGFAQGIGYLIASAGPLAIGVVHEATGSWTVPGLILLLVAGLQLITGWLAGRAVTLPAMPASAWTPPAAPDGSA